MDQQALNPEKHKILIVDDVRANLDVLQRILSAEGYNLSVALEGEIALKIASRLKPDIILLDIMMPGIDGYEVCRRLKADPDLDSIPVIFISAKNEIQDIVEGFRLGGVDYIIKPFRNEEVLVRIKTHLELNDFKKKQQKKIVELELKTRKLMELDQIKNRFLGITAHDLRNPLSSIMGFTDLLILKEDKLSNEEKNQMISFINLVCGDLLTLVNDLLDVSVFESGKLDLNIQECDLKPIVETQIRLNAFHANKKNIEFILALEDIPKIQLDSNRIIQVIDNLLSNAVKFSPPDSKVRVGLVKKNDNVELTVQDEGPGVAEEDRSLLFKEYQKLGGKPTAGEKSTGLGLAIVKKIVDAHQGTIQLDGDLEKGSLFNVQLPIQPQSERGNPLS